MNAPDLGGGAGGTLVVTDGSSDLGYRSCTETHWTTEPRSLQSFHMMLQWECSAAVSLTYRLYLCASARCDHTREDLWLPHAPCQIFQYSVRMFSFLSVILGFRRLYLQAGMSQKLGYLGKCLCFFWRPVPVFLDWSCQLLVFCASIPNVQICPLSCQEISTFYKDSGCVTDICLLTT